MKDDVSLGNLSPCRIIRLNIRKLIGAVFTKNIAPIWFRRCPFSGFAQAEVVTFDAIVLVFSPAEFLDGLTKNGQIGYVALFQMLAEFLLDGGGGPEVLFLMYR